MDDNADADARVLEAERFQVSWESPRTGFRRAWIERDGAGMKVEWAYDSAFRFFPVQPDPALDYRLHDADLAVNKVLAGAGRLVIHDHLDILI